MNLLGVSLLLDEGVPAEVINEGEEGPELCKSIKLIQTLIG